MKGKVKSLSEVMAVANKYARSDKTRDASDGEEEEVAAKGKKNSNKPQQQQTSHNNASQNKRKSEDGHSGLVANTRGGFRGQRGRGRGYGSRPINMQEVFNRPCDLHATGDGRPADHTKAQCHYYKKWKEESQHNGGIPTKKTLVRLITQILGSTTQVTPGKRGSITQ